MSYIGRYGTGALPVPDRIIRKEGVWCVERNTAVVDLTTATWNNSTNYLMPNLNGDLIRGQESHWVLCTHFPSSGANPSTVWTAGIWMGLGLAINKESLPNGTATTPKEMAEWCAAQSEAGTPVLVCYAQTEPAYEELNQDVQVLLNTLIVPSGTCSVWFSGEIIPSSADIGIPRGDFPSENARALAMTRADRTLSNLTDYQKALHNIGSRPNKNLLDNWYFVGGGIGYGVFPVNQRGSTAGTAGWDSFFADRWKGSCVYQYNDDSVTISGDGYIVQDLSYSPIFPITASVLTKTGFYWVTFNNIGSLGVDGMEGYFDLQSNYLAVKWSVQTDVISVKLEYGDKQTHCYQDSTGQWKLFETPNYGEELVRCQRYQLALWQYFISPAVHFATDYIDFSIPTPVEMRTAPTIDADGISIISDGKGNQTGFTLSVVAKSSNAVCIRATKTGHGLSFTDSVRFEVTGEHAMLNANM